MKQVVIIHGKPTRERYENPDLPKPHEANWLPWIQHELGERGIQALIPALPTPYYPVYEAWRDKVAAYDINRETALVGFSAGAEFVLRWLSENKHLTPGNVSLVAPWQDNKGKYGDFSQYTLDSEIGTRIGKIAIFNSLDDSLPIQQNVQRIHGLIPEAKIVNLDGYGHFMLGNNMKSEEFPELLEELVQ